MIGIPYRIMRDSDQEGLVEKTVYLATRRSGEAGESMRQSRRDFNKHNLAAAKAGKRLLSVDRRLENLPADDERLDALENESEKLLGVIQEQSDKAQEAATKLVRLSLTEVYGTNEKAGEIMDMLSDKDVLGMVLAIESGEQPEDFFPSPDRRPRQTSTSPPGDSPPRPSSEADSPGPTSEPAG